MLFNIHTGRGIEELLELFRIPASDDAGGALFQRDLWRVSRVPGLEGFRIAGIAGDQQAALFGQHASARD